MSELKLVALDEDDLAVISAHCQDAVFKTGDISYQPESKRLLIALNRFVWEKETGLFSRRHERRRAVLHLDRVNSVKLAAVDRSRTEDVHSLLALRFAEGDLPAGSIDLVLSGGAAIRVEVECIEARLADLGAAWDTGAKPKHAV